MLRTIIDAFKVPELRNKILFTLGILALYRFGAYVPVPASLSANSLMLLRKAASAWLLDLFTGGALSHFSVFSLGIMCLHYGIDYHAAYAGVIPAVGRWAKEGESGRKRRLPRLLVS
ncbi:MAG: hypothetical protein ACLT98_02210 [Eggerthellaceae bacterium]